MKKAHKILVVVVAAVVVFIIIGAVAGSGSKKTPSSTPTSTVAKRDLAKDVQAAYLKQTGYKTIADLNLDKKDVVGAPENEITSFDNETNDTVKVTVQDDLTKEQAKSIGQSVMVAAGDVKALKWLDIRGTNNVYAEVSRQDAGLTD